MTTVTPPDTEDKYHDAASSDDLVMEAFTVLVQPLSKNKIRYDKVKNMNKNIMVSDWGFNKVSVSSSLCC